MKSKILVAGCLLMMSLGTSLAIADSDGATQGPVPRLGVEGGINLANLNGPNVNDVIGSRLGFVGGAFLSLPLGPFLEFQPEVLYEQKGGNFNGNPYQLDYVEIPLLLDVNFLGPLGILLGPSFDSNVFNHNVVDANSTDVGLVVGLQLNISQLLLSGRYEIGLTDINNNQNIQNGTFTFLIGLSII